MKTRLAPSAFSIPIPESADLMQLADGLEIQDKDRIEFGKRAAREDLRYYFVNYKTIIAHIS